jgi:hypothetical protein
MPAMSHEKVNIFSDAVDALRPTVQRVVEKHIADYRRGHMDELVFMWEMDKVNKGYEKLMKGLTSLIDPDNLVK